jgi:hypothetical protein
MFSAKQVTCFCASAVKLLNVDLIGKILYVSTFTYDKVKIIVEKNKLKIIGLLRIFLLVC